MRICVSLTEKTTREMIGRMADLTGLSDLFEVRGDLAEELGLFPILQARSQPLLFTCLPQSEGGRWPDEDPRRHAMLLEAVQRGFDYVDVNLMSGFSDVMVEKAGRGLVVSYHNLGAMPKDLFALYQRMAATGADIVKIAVMPRSVADVGRLMAFAARVATGDGPALIPIAMGPLGAPTRILGGRDRVPFTFASAQSGAEAAPGQIPLQLMADLYRVREVNPQTRVYGILGRHVHKSLALAVHNRGFHALGIDAVCVPLEADALPAFLEALAGLRLSGFSVKQPYAPAILDHLDEVDVAARRLGSVDTVAIENGRLRGFLMTPAADSDATGDVDALLRQASAQFEAWTCCPAPIDVMREALLEVASRTP